MPDMPSSLPDAATGKVVDYVSGQEVRATPEEVEAVQVFSRRLVEDYGYPLAHIQTHPQFRVRRRPSDEERSYPVDIAVFRTERRLEDDLFLLVECKKANRRDGLAQLRLYMDMSPAEVGVWFNGFEHVYLRKIVHRDGRRTYEELPNIPRYGERIEDIGLYRRRELKKPSNLKSVFRDIRNHLAGNVTGITRDEALAQEIIAILFCKIFDEVNTGQDQIVTFRSAQGEEPEEVANRINQLFSSVKSEYNDVFLADETIKLDSAALVYVVGELQNYSILEADRDAIGDAFEVFIGPALRGAEGQFFTPRNVVRMVISLIDPRPGEMLIDPACGSGGFLVTALEWVWSKLDEQGKELGWTPIQIDRRKRDVATRFFRGLDKDSFLAKVTKAYMAIMGDGRGGIFCENSLLAPQEWHQSTQNAIQLGAFDVVLTNPPFGSKIPVRGPTVLAQYDLGFRWKRQQVSGNFEKGATLHDDQSPQLLFLERCLQLLRDGGRLGIVLPESMLGNPSYEFVLAWLLSKAELQAVVTMPESLFKTSGKGGTHTKVAVLVLRKAATPRDDYHFFMGDAKWCGHDSRGNPTIRRLPDGRQVLLDDIPLVAERYRQSMAGESESEDHLGFMISTSELKGTVLVPKFYDPELQRHLQLLASSHDLKLVGDLVKGGILQITTGVEVGKMAYGTGSIPFIRTSDISNWELKADPKHGVSEDIFESLKSKAEVRPGDILMVRDGTYLIGTSAIVTEHDPKILFQSHIMRLRVLKPEILDPWLLFAALNSPTVKKQIQAMRFTQDIIDTLGGRILDVFVPLPKDDRTRERVAKETREVVEARSVLRNRAREIALEVDSRELLTEEDTELLEAL